MMTNPSIDKSMYTIIYTYDENPSTYYCMYVPYEDFWMVMEDRGMQEEPAKIAEIIRHKVEPVEKEDNSLWIKNWRIR